MDQHGSGTDILFSLKRNPWPHRCLSPQKKPVSPRAERYTTFAIHNIFNTAGYSVANKRAFVKKDLQA